MSDPSLFFAFLAAAAILTITPGVDTAMVLRSATVEGRRSAILASFGIGLGCLVWGAAVALGLATAVTVIVFVFVSLVNLGRAHSEARQ